MTCPDGLTASENRITDVTAVILAGGTSSRMGRNKALLPCRGGRFIDAIHRRLAELFDEVVVITNTPGDYPLLACRTAPDIYRGKGALAGIHAGLVHSETPRIFVVACDMPYLNPTLIRVLVDEMDSRHDVLVPIGGKGFLEPLHALYRKSCLTEMEAALKADRKSILDLYDRVRTRIFTGDEVRRIDPDFTSFRNINTPEEYAAFRQEDRNDELATEASGSYA